jgi:hypothetical protein
MIVGRDDERTSSLPPDGCREIEQRHRVEAPGHGENGASPLRQGVRHQGGQVFAARRFFSIFFAPSQREPFVESHGPLGTLWVGLALGAFYIALIWLNTLLGFLLTPLFLIPQTWLMDWVARRRGRSTDRHAERDASR